MAVWDRRAIISFLTAFMNPFLLLKAESREVKTASSDLMQLNYNFFLPAQPCQDKTKVLDFSSPIRNR